MDQMGRDFTLPILMTVSEVDFPAIGELRATQLKIAALRIQLWWNHRERKGIGIAVLERAIKEASAVVALETIVHVLSLGVTVAGP